MSRAIPDSGPACRTAWPLARDDILPVRVVLLSRKTSHDGENNVSTEQPGISDCSGKTPKIRTNKSRGRDAMRGLIGCLAVALSCAAGGSACAEISDNVVRIGVLNDISGIFQDTNGMGSVEAARMAAEDFNGGGKSIKVEIVYADHQNKADVGSAIVRKWLDVDKVDAVVDVPNSAVGLTVNALLRDTRMTFLASSTASSDLTGKACSPNTIQWVNDAWATGNTTAAAMMKRGGMDWYFITVNYALGQGIEAEATSYIEKHGGKVLGSARHPLNTPDFASLLLQAQNSKAKVIGLANAGGDTINAVKQAGEFGIKEGGQTLVAFLLFINDVHGMGLKVAQGLQLLEAFYWDMNDDTRAFARRFAARPGMNGKMPSGNQAGVYASTLAYLNAVAATGSDDARDVVPQMKKFRGQDKLFGDVAIRQDGRVIHPMYLFEVKKPEESKYPYDYYKLVSTTSADQAFRPIADGGCSLVK
jgi:branched-chain amino acid transport system substrate-binding protein